MKEQYRRNIYEFMYHRIEIYSVDPNGRYKSYEHCRKVFLDNKNDPKKYDYITLHLYAYLASWGMLRNSFLMKKDYLFNKPVVEILCKEEYSRLINFAPFIENNQEDIDLILRLKDEIKGYYLNQGYFNDLNGEMTQITSVTDTLVSKIILGTIGCIVAYDKYLIRTLSKLHICQSFNSNSINSIIGFARVNQDDIMRLTEELGELYTPMKVVDMYLWEQGLIE